MPTLTYAIREDLNQARRAVADAQASLAATEATRIPLLAERAKIDAKLASIDVVAGKDRDRIAQADRALGAAEDAALEKYTRKFSGMAVRMHAEDAEGHEVEIGNVLHLLSRAVRPEIDWPVNAGPYKVSPVVQQALALLPERDAMHTPVYELGYGGRMTWRERCRALLAEFEALEANETSPLEAA